MIISRLPRSDSRLVLFIGRWLANLCGQLGDPLFVLCLYRLTKLDQIPLAKFPPLTPLWRLLKFGRAKVHIVPMVCGALPFWRRGQRLLQSLHRFDAIHDDALGMHTSEGWLLIKEMMRRQTQCSLNDPFHSVLSEAASLAPILRWRRIRVHSTRQKKGLFQLRSRQPLAGCRVQGFL